MWQQVRSHMADTVPCRTTERTCLCKITQDKRTQNSTHGGHSEHAIAPVRFANLPGTHSEHSDSPSVSAYLQRMSLNLIPMRSETNLPSWQLLHCLPPNQSCAVPAPIHCQSSRGKT